jgi:predicted Zn-dependent peptidase
MKKKIDTNKLNDEMIKLEETPKELTEQEKEEYSKFRQAQESKFKDLIEQLTLDELWAYAKTWLNEAVIKDIMWGFTDDRAIDEAITDMNSIIQHRKINKDVKEQLEEMN